MLHENFSKAHQNSSLWVWARIRALRRFRADIVNIETSLLELARLADLNKKKQIASEKPSKKILRP